MNKKVNKKMALALTLCAVAIALFASFGASRFIQAQKNAQNKSFSSESNLPILDYNKEIEKPLTEEERLKSSRIESLGNPRQAEPLSELPYGAEMLPVSGHWWVGIEAIPVQKSNVIVIGKINEAEAHLSSDRTGVYSEFSIEIEKVFKDETSSLKIAEIVSANRSGGAVRFASGKVQEYRFRRQAMPRADGRYLLFLRRSEAGDLDILTGYELLNGIVRPLDGEDVKDSRSALVFSKYRGKSETQLLKDLQAAIRTSIEKESD